MRLDKVLAERYPNLSRSKIQQLIVGGGVTIDGTVVTRAGCDVPGHAHIELDRSILRYVSRAGLKLEHALKTFTVSVSGAICLDAGLSTGGFTDCLLHHGAVKVYGVDVGTAQVAPVIAHDLRVTVMEKTDIRTLDMLPESIDVITLDLSFISLTLVAKAVAGMLVPGGRAITLIKPQFEVGLEAARAARGVIHDPALQQQAVDTVVRAFNVAGFVHHGTTPSPILGGSGNKEFLAYFTKGSS